MKTQHEVLMENPEFRKLLSIESLVAEASEVIAKLMAKRNVSKADLARRLNKSRAWVTQLLSGKTNMTVRTLAEVVHALNGEVKLHAEPMSWKISAQRLGAGCPKVYVTPQTAAENRFRLHDQKALAPLELLSVKYDPDTMRSEYAA